MSDMGNISDGYHTFNELYDHRCHLFVALMRSHPGISWRAHNHDDGSNYEGWFIGGMQLPTGTVTYHMPVSMWALLDGVGVATMMRAPKWDGHTSADVVKRLAAWCSAQETPPAPEPPEAMWKCCICDTHNYSTETHCTQCEYSRMTMRDGKLIPRTGRL